MLGVEKDVEKAQLKRSYKKTCLRVHPDKNSAPDADEAFKKINAAMACLSDPVKRRQYNQVRNCETFETRQSQGNSAGFSFNRSRPSYHDGFNHS